MIIREWRGRASPANAEAYPAHFRKNVMPALRQLDGFLGAHLSQRRSHDRMEFLVLTRWRSRHAIRSFAGDNVEQAIVEPEAVAALEDFDTFVRHYEVLEDVPAGPA